MATVAAFFDLDRTILARSSSFALARPLHAAGLISRRMMLRSAVAQLAYLRSGVDHATMERLRDQLSALVTGWEVERVRGIVAAAIDDVIAPMVYPEAVELIDGHRAAGHDIVIVSTSGTQVVEPIGELLGADLVVGTDVAVEDGAFTGEVTFYSYGPGKAEAMRRIAAERGYDLAECSAYSDSHTDLPMLEAVGHPVAVNPDAALRRIALERGWPVRDFPTPPALRRARRPRRPSRPRRPGSARAIAAVAAVAGLAIGVAVARQTVTARAPRATQAANQRTIASAPSGVPLA